MRQDVGVKERQRSVKACAPDHETKFSSAEPTAARVMIVARDSKKVQ